MSDQRRNLPHLYLSGNGESENYTSRGVGGYIDHPPIRDRENHAIALKQALNQAINEAKQKLNLRDPEISVGTPGFYLEFQVHSDNMNIFEKLEDKRKKIELVTVRKSPSQEDIVEAIVFVPETASDHFLSKVEQYHTENSRFGKKPKNETLVSRIQAVKLGTVRSLFTDNDYLFPQSTQKVWWEVWLRKDQSIAFNLLLERLNIETKQNIIYFPNREVMLVKANLESMAMIVDSSNVVAELNILHFATQDAEIQPLIKIFSPKNQNYTSSIAHNLESSIEGDSPSFFLDMGPMEQEKWSNDLENHLLQPDDDSVAICLLDSGVAQIHPLITPALELADMHTCNPAWGVNANNACGHGTKMAGLALYSDLFDALQTLQPIQLSHRLESVKILPPMGQNEPELYGAITEQAIALPEIQHPKRSRVFCMAVTSEDSSPNTGSPSSWSAAIDKLCFGDDEFRRLIIISGGNIRQDILPSDYLNINDVSPIENPCQSWNSLVVGAYTEKVNITDSTFTGWQPLAPAGDLSPRSRTSVSWSNQWPIRPDVVFEGGNLASDGENPAIYMDDLCLLTTHHRPNLRVFDRMGDTSSATALASYMAAQIMSKYPSYNPETIRALMVHSAEWTPLMQKSFKNVNRKSEMRTFLRRYGYGVPDLNRALQSANNDLTLIVEDDLQPFRLDDDNIIKTRYMKFHQLPWPREELEKLVEASVELKVTLSYFIEPNPGERGWGRLHQYASHGLRFEVKRPSENDNDFRRRINRAATDEEEKSSNSNRNDNDNWFLGKRNRDRGSIHSDIWYGSAADLAQRGAIAVYPVGGWWKENKTLERWKESVRYSLIVSIRVPSIEVDIYTPVANLIEVPVPISIS